jgi:hypothetical protein
VYGRHGRAGRLILYFEAKQDELADRTPRDGYNHQAIRSRLKHPIQNLVGTAARLADQEVANTVVPVVPDTVCPTSG